MLGPDAQFTGSAYPEVGLSGMFPVRAPDACEVAVLQGGEDSFAVRLQTLANAKQSIRIQALVFRGDEAGLRIAELLKQKKAAGLDVRVIVDAFSNPGLQTQWMMFDLKQHGIEVEGYEALALQWLNEVPVPLLTPHTDPNALNQRYHEKMWIVDGETPAAIAVTGGLNIGNEYFRADPWHPDKTWRDQDVVLRGAVVADLVTLAALRILPIAMSSLLGVLALILTGCLKFEGLGRGISAEVVLIVVASLALGRSLTATGGADLLASGFMSVASGLSPQAVLAAVMIFLGILTNFVSNNAAAAVGTPVALAIAAQIGAPPEPFVLAAIVGCNLSFATPMGYQTNVLIMQPGGYVFGDFVRVGGPLVILMIVAFSIELARVYPI